MQPHGFPQTVMHTAPHGRKSSGTWIHRTSHGAMLLHTKALRTQHTVRRTYSCARFHTRLHTAAQAKHVRFHTVSARRAVEPQKARMASLSCIETNGDTRVHTPLRTRLHTRLLTARPHCFDSRRHRRHCLPPAVVEAGPAWCPTHPVPLKASPYAGSKVVYAWRGSRSQRF